MRTIHGQTKRWWIAAFVTVLGLLSAGVVAVDAKADPESTGDATEVRSPETADDPARQIVLYYMHGARRCKTCRSIEAYAKGVVDSRFAEALEAGALSWKVVDYDKPENRHFIEEFGLFTSSLVVVETERGEIVEFEVLHEAWSLVRDKTRFQQYVYRALREHLG